MKKAEPWGKFFASCNIVINVLMTAGRRDFEIGYLPCVRQG